MVLGQHGRQRIGQLILASERFRQLRRVLKERRREAVDSRIVPRGLPALQPTGGAQFLQLGSRGFLYEMLKKEFVIKEEKGNTIETPANFALAHCISLDRRMSKGFAKQVCEQYGRPDIDEKYNKNKYNNIEGGVLEGRRENNEEEEEEEEDDEEEEVEG